MFRTMFGELSTAALNAKEMVIDTGIGIQDLAYVGDMSLFALSGHLTQGSTFEMVGS